MKKLLFSILMILSTFVVSAQCADSVTVFFENFDGASVKTRSSTSHVPTGTDWSPNTLLSVSPTKSMHSPLYVTSALKSQLFIDTIRFVTGKNKIYLSFDHICKVSNLDQSFIQYRFSTGGNAVTGYTYSGWTNMVFTHTSPNYYGGANATDAILGGKFSHMTYPTLWQSTNNNALPNNTWWQSELIDISQYVVGAGDGQVFEISFFTNRAFTGQHLCPDGGWFLDNVRIIASNKDLVPPKITLATPTVINNVTNFGPFTIKANVIDRPTNATFPDSVKLHYTENGGAPILAPKIQLSPTQFQWTIPTQCNGTVVRYKITARDSACNISTPLDTVFTVVLSTTGTTTNGVQMMGIHNAPFAIEVGNPTPVEVIIKNRANNPMTSAVITMTLNNVPQPSYNWSSVTDYHPTRPFCLDFIDTLNIGSFSPIAGWDTLRVCVTHRNGALNNYTPATSQCSQYIRFGCAAILTGPLTIGGTGADFPSLTDFFITLENCGMNGPIIAKLASGNYSSNLFFFNTLFAGQSATNTITFESQTGNPADVTIIDDSNLASRGAITFDGTINGIGHMRFKNLTIQGKTGSTNSRGIYITGKNVTNIKIEKCIINIDTPASTSNLFSGISRITASTGTIGDEDIEIKGTTINGGVYGIHYLGSGARINNIISIDSNTINSSYHGIYLTYTNVPEIKKNKITQHTSSVQRFTGIHLERSATTSTISKNKIWADVNANVGINLNNVSNGATGDILISNNEINVKATIAGTYGINNTLSTRMNYLHNSIRVYSVTNLAITACYYHTSGAIINFSNNVLVNKSISLTNQNFPIYYASIPTALVGDYNVYHSDGPVGYYTVARNTMDEWKNALSYTRDTLTISIEPPFINTNSSLKLSDFSGFECPKNLLIGDDIQDSLRLCEVTHRGCYGTYVPPKDLALVQLISPILGTCPQISYPITLKVFNYGCTTVNFANTPAIIKTIATGGLTLNNNYTINTGTLAPMQSIDVTINPGVAIPYNVNINFTFIMTYTGDERSSNDTLSIPFRLEVIAPSVATYDETFSNGTSLTWKIEQLTGAGNWSFQEGSSANPIIDPVYGTGRLFFNSKTFAVNTSSRATMPVLDLTNSNFPILEVWYAHDNFAPTNTEGVTVKISTDGGTTWTAISPETPNPTNTNTSLLKRGQSTITGYTLPAWIKYTYDLSAYNTNNCVFIAFEVTGKKGNDINIDRVRVRKIFANDCAVQNIYTTHVRPTTVETSPQVKAIITNEGRNAQNNVQVTLTISGANTYTETVTVPTIPYNGQAIATFTGNHLGIIGANNIKVSCQNDDNNGNNNSNAILTTNVNNIAYADTTSYHINFGSENPIKAVVKYNVIDTVIATSVKFYPTNALETVGKKVRAFISNANGNIITTSNIITMTADMVNTWVTIPINNYALTHTSTLFYAGIEMIDAGYYLTAQLESPTRSDVFYYLDEETYVPQALGRFMIGATVEPKIDREFAILSVINPVSDCDLDIESIKIRVANNGPKHILPGTTLHYTVNNGPVITQTIPDTIFSHQIRSFTFTTPYNFTNNQINIDDNYTLKIWADANSSDNVRFNDTIQKLVVSKGKAHLPIAPDTILVSYSTHGILTAQLPPQINPGIIQWFTKVGNEYVGPLYQGPGPYVTPNLIYYDTTYYASVAPGTLYSPIVGTLSNANSPIPFTFTSGYSRGRILYKQSEIGNYGVIAKIAINVNTAATGLLGIPIKIYIKQTDIESFQSTDLLDWENEVADATVILDAQHYFSSTGWVELTLPEPLNYESGNLIIYTESNCGGTNCSANSGAAGYPTFKTSTAANTVQYKTANNNPVFPNTWGAATANRWVMQFFIADIDCASARVPVQLHVGNKPNYDLETEAFIYPITTPASNVNCALYNEHIVVKYKNLLDISIPANKVLAKAGFRNGATGPYTWITHLVTDSFAPLEEKEITFTQTYDFSAPTANRTIQFIATSDLVNEANVFRLNDTITGTIISTRTAPIPDQLTYFGNFTETFQIIPGIAHTPTISQYFFYATDTSTTPLNAINGSPNWTTPNLYDTIVYYMTARTPASPYCITKRIPVTINVAVPTNNHDLRTNKLVFPVSYTCGLMNPNLIVNFNNTDSVIIPTRTFKVTAKFTGSNNVTVVDTIIPLFAAVNRLPAVQPTHDIVFNRPVALGSILQNRIYNYEIFTDAVNPSYQPYRLNDTIRGDLKVPANPTAPANLTYTVPYGQTLNITPLTNPLNSGTPLNRVTFYDALGTTPILSGTNFTTPNIYGPTTYKYGGRIISDGFEKDSIVGLTSTANGQLPFVFTQTESQGAVLFRNVDMGEYVGYIDTLSIYVHANVTGSFPIQIYLKNTDSTSLPTGSYNWTTYFLNGSTLIYDNTPEFSTGWLQIPIPGGFYYTGKSLLMLTSHNCFGQPNVAALNIAPLPTFKYGMVPANPNLVLYRGGATPTAPVNFSGSTQRITTRFSMNYTCESPKANITINTTVPGVDIHVTGITTPITPSNTYPTNQIVAATITNHGTNNASGFTMGYQLGNNPPIEQPFSGAIAAGATSNFTFAVPVDLSNIYFSTPFIVYVRHNSDPLQTNDTSRIFLKKFDPCNPIIVVGARDTIGAHISKFKFAGIDNGPGTPIFSCPASISGNGQYSDFTETVAPGFVVRGQSFPITIVNSFTTNAGATLWKYVFLDMNRDNEFTPDELIFSKLAVTSPSVANQTNATTSGFTSTINIDAQTGTTRLRVITSNQNLGATANPCAAFLLGETEDYAVNIADPYPIDPGTTHILHPVGNICADDRAKIKVVIKNFGSSDLVLSPENPLIVNATVAGPVNGNHTITITSGTVAQWDTMIAVIHNVDLSMIGNYVVDANIQYTIDQFVFNNMASSTCEVTSLVTHTLPIFVNFDADDYVPGGDVPFAPFWNATTTHTTFKWDVDSLGTLNAPVAGPSFDHTFYNHYLQNEGRYAVVSAPANSNINAMATLSTGCINLHYHDGYPCETEYWQHIFGLPAATSKFYIEVGSGEYFITMDSIIGRTHTAINQEFTKRSFVLNQIDENARIKFIVTGRTNKIDPAIDDISFKHGRADISIQNFIYPLDFTVADVDCVVKGDTVRPTVTIKNVGRVPILNFEINFNAAIGTNIQTTPNESWTGFLNSGESIEYTFTNGVVVPELFSYLQFQAHIQTINDENLQNNIRTITACTTVGIDDEIQIQNGVILSQNIPNPAINETVIPFYTSNPGETVLQIHSIEGQLLYTTKMIAEIGENNIHVNTSNFSSAIYMYTIIINNTKLTRKMIIQQ